jgi:hypothetical protein
MVKKLYYTNLIAYKYMLSKNKKKMIMKWFSFGIDLPNKVDPGLYWIPHCKKLEENASASCSLTQNSGGCVNLNNSCIFFDSSHYIIPWF